MGFLFFVCFEGIASSVKCLSLYVHIFLLPSATGRLCVDKERISKFQSFEILFSVSFYSELGVCVYYKFFISVVGKLSYCL